MDEVDVLETIAQQVEVCEKCELHFSRKKSVPGEGPANAAILFVGEGPGFYENEQGRPFVGPSGKFLDDLLQRAGMKRSEVFIGNVVKCRPPANRDPLPDELTACRPYLEKQIETINPKAVVTLGRFSMAYFLPNAKISLIHGKPAWVNGRLVIPMFHPAAALHQPALREAILGDFSNLPGILKKAFSTQDELEPVSVENLGISANPGEGKPQPKALDLFSYQPETSDDDSEEGTIQLSLF
jgi:uracil-DNA glycosylase